MSQHYRELADRIRGEVPDLNRLVQRALSGWSSAKEALDTQDIYIDSVALSLHGFYSGIERLFELIAKHVDQNLPSGEMWHRDLLQQMAREEGDIRPAVISQGMISPLDELRRFRHLVRNIYTFNLMPDKVEPLVISLPGVWSQLQAELSAFADFLSDLAGAT